MTDRLILDYIPIDRYLAISAGIELASKVQGSALFADISGFTPLTDALARSLGPRQGAEQLTLHLNRVYDALISEIHLYHGSVISFSGDAITCWFDDESPGAALRATVCALAMQAAMSAFSSLPLPNGETLSLAMKVAIASGSARRFSVGSPGIQRMDALAGKTVIRMATAEHHATSREIVVDAATAASLTEHAEIKEWREDTDTGERFAVVAGLLHSVEPFPWPTIDAQSVNDSEIRPWLLRPVYERLSTGMGEFLTELRPTVVFFLRFDGIDYDEDETAGQKLDVLVRRAQEIVTRQDGALLQLTIGDKGSYVYGAFGAPIAHENDAWRAVAAAWELKHLSNELSFIKPVQIGISRGTLRTGSYGGVNRRTYGVIGNEVNLAARLMQAAPAGEVYVSEYVQQVVRKQFTWESLTPIYVKGKIEAVHVFRLVGMSSEPTVQLRKLTYTTQMIGREIELNRMAEKLKLAQEGHGQVIGINADAGMGKSRLLSEFMRLARLRSIKVYVGECQSYGINSPYLVWHTLLMDFFDLQSSQTLDEQTKILHQELEQINPALLSRLPLLGTVLGLKIPDNDFTRTLTLDPQLRKTALEALLLDVLSSRAIQAKVEGAVVVFVLDDLHWIDSASLDLLQLLAQSAQEWNVLIITAYRTSEDSNKREIRLESQPHFTKILLGLLSSDEITRLAEIKLDQLGFDSISNVLLQRLLKRAEGNPFYIEELLNYLHDRGIKLDSTEDIELPSSLESLILSRIDQLTEHQKITLKVASIIGRRFHLARLYGYYPALGDLHQLRIDLEHLSDIEITPVDQPEPEVIYLFKHILTQEVAYESLAFETRKTLHERFAAYLETGNLDQLVDLIAYHYERTDNLLKKREYFQKAGEAAIQRYANVEAVEYLSRALSLWDEQHALERFSLLYLREEVLHNQGARDAQAHDIELLEGLAEDLRDDQRRAHVALRRTKYLKAISNFPDALSSAQKAIHWAIVSKSPEIEAEGYLEIGQTLWFQSKFPEAKTQLELSLQKSAEFPRLQAYALRNLGMISIRQNDFAAAQKHYERAIASFRTLGDRRGEAQALGDVGNIHFFQGLFAEARSSYEKALVLYREIGLRWGICAILNNLANVVADDKGDYLLAQGYLRESLTIARQIGQRYTESNALNNLGFYALALGEYEAAQSYFEQSLNLARALGDRHEEGVLLNNLGIVSVSQGDYGTALSLYEQSLKLKLEIGDRVGESETFGFLALLQCELSNHQSAFEYSQQALTIAKEVDASLEESRAYLALGHALTSLGRNDEAVTAYQSCLDLRREIGQNHLALEPLAGLAQIALLRSDLPSALASVQTILEDLNMRSVDGLEEPGRIYLTCYKVLQHAQAERSQQVLKTAYDVLQKRASKIANQSNRRYFLQNILSHREIVETMTDILNSSKSTT